MEYTFHLYSPDDRRSTVTVEADSYEEASEAIATVRDRDFPGAEIEDA